MKIVVDELLVDFVGGQKVAINLRDAINLARGIALETGNWACVTGFEDEKPSHIFIGSVCYVPQITKN